MKIKIIDKLERQNIDGKVQMNYIPVNAKRCDELEVAFEDINVLSRNKQLRLIGIGKNLFRLSLASWKDLRKQLNKNGMIYRING